MLSKAVSSIINILKDLADNAFNLHFKKKQFKELKRKFRFLQRIIMSKLPQFEINLKIHQITTQNEIKKYLELQDQYLDMNEDEDAIMIEDDPSKKKKDKKKKKKDKK